MADNNQDLKSSSKLPRLSKIQTSVPKLPTLHKAASPGAGGEKSIIPALSSNAAQVPVSNPLEALDDGEETQAIAAPSEAELEAAVAAMREQNHAADDDQEKTRAVTVHKSAAPAPIQVTAPAPGPAPIQKFVTKAPAKAEPKPAPAAAVDSDKNKLSSSGKLPGLKLRPLSLGTAADKAGAVSRPALSDLEEQEETQAIDVPDFSAMEMPASSGPIAISPEAMTSAPAPVAAAPAPAPMAAAPAPAPMAAAPAPAPAAAAPALAPAAAAPALAPAAAAPALAPVAAAPALAAAAAAPALAPAAAPAAPIFGAAPAPSAPIFGVAPQQRPVGPAASKYPVPVVQAIGRPPVPEESEPIFGGAAAENNDLQFEDESPDDAGEKTLMLDSASDEETDIGGEKTQISLNCMDFDPLSGKLIVESGKTSQREYILVREKTSIGRSPDNDITISDISMSRKHVEIDKFPEGFRIRDLNSGNGTVLNGYRIRVAQLRSNDIIEIGSIRFRFEQYGGDPDELWKGEPKIEYHPNQRAGSGSRSPSLSPSATGVPPSPSAMAQPAAISQPMGMPSGGYSLPSPSGPMPQMEAMLERQGGGIAAPSWAGAPPLTSPYMMSYGPNALKNATTTPIWANIVLAALFCCCVGTLVFWIFTQISTSAQEEQVKERTALVEQIRLEVNKGIDNYTNQSYAGALININNAAAMDKDNIVIKDKAVFDFYRKLLIQEEDYNKTIKQIRSRNATSLIEYEEDLEFLEKIPENSMNKALADTTHTRLLEGYRRRLRNDIRQYISDNDIPEARKLIEKLSTIPDAANDVKTLNKLIADKEKIQK